MLSTILLIVVVIVAAVLVLAAMRPNNFRVERQALVTAIPDKIFPLITDFHQWKSWSPWEKMDPQMTRTYSGGSARRGRNLCLAGKQEGWRGAHGNPRGESALGDPHQA